MRARTLSAWLSIMGVALGLCWLPSLSLWPAWSSQSPPASPSSSRYYVYEGEVREAYRPKGLPAYATASRDVRLL